MSWSSLPSHECRPLLCVTRVCQLILVQFQLGLSQCGSHGGWSTTLLNHLIRVASEVLVGLSLEFSLDVVLARKPILRRPLHLDSPCPLPSSPTRSLRKRRECF